MIQALNPKLDLSTERLIKAPRAAVWKAWADPRCLEQWWIPAPMRCKVLALDLCAGGAFVTEMAEEGQGFVPHQSACFLAVDPMERIVFTNMLLGGWRPAEKPFLSLTAIITFSDHPDGTNYVAHVMHGKPDDRAKHEEYGFHDGWGTVAMQLANFVE
jgi:uncharacterized protein YndB with AHSA1/START domain